MIYLDNSSTTHKKPLSVKLALLKGVNYLSINSSRGSYKRALDGANAIFETRETLSNYFGTTPENVVFTKGCTEALNLAIFGTARKNGHIITTIYEHNSTLRPLEKLKSTHNISVTYLKPNKEGKISTKEISHSIKNNTYMIIINHTSNVTGATQNIESIGKIAKKNNLLFLVDAAQSGGHENINMQKQNINLLTIAGHKGFYAPEGIGALLINNANVAPLILGGTGTYSDKLTQPSDYPDGLESGTLNLPGILALRAGVDFVTKNQDKINTKIESLTEELIYQLNRIKNIDIYGNAKAGIASISIKNKDSVEVTKILDEKYNIATRSGLHCAPLIHKYLGTLKKGLTRISISYYNNKQDIRKIVKAIEEIALN